MPFKVSILPKEQRVKKWEMGVKFFILLLEAGKIPKNKHIILISGAKYHNSYSKWDF